MTDFNPDAIGTSDASTHGDNPPVSGEVAGRMTARDEAIAAMFPDDDEVFPPDEIAREWAGRLLDRIPPDVLARLTIERGGLEIEVIDLMLARADNITEGSIDRFARDTWSYQETNFARLLIADLAATLRATMSKGTPT